MKKIGLSVIMTIMSITVIYSQTNIFPTTGNAGIGITSPETDSKLQINTSATVPQYLRISKTNSGTSVLLGDGGNAVASGILRLYEGGVEKSRIYGGGDSWFTNRVGIGITSPETDSKLQINTSATVPQYLRISKTNSGTSVLLGDGGSAVASGILRLYEGGVEKSRIYGGGDSWFTNSVGIGITSPETDSKLQINTSATVPQYLRISKTNSGTSVLLGDGGSTVASGILRLYEGGIEKSRVYGGGDSWFINNVGVGTTSPAYKLDVAGTIRACEVKVDLGSNKCPDYVFKSNYKLMDLKELEIFVKTNSHLPEIPSEKEMVENGIDMKDFQLKLLQKMEEMTLYIIEQNKRIEKLEKENAELIKK